jgi:hypothetical protein
MEGRFQAKLASDGLILDNPGADQGRRRVTAAENSRWPATALG